MAITPPCVLMFACGRCGGDYAENDAAVTHASPILGKTIRVSLRGEGVRPVLTMEPTDGRLDMGDVLEGDVVERCALELYL